MSGCSIPVALARTIRHHLQQQLPVRLRLQAQLRVWDRPDNGSRRRQRALSTSDGARSVLQRLTEAAEINIDHPKHDYLAPHSGRRGMREVLVRAFEYTVAARYLDTRRRWFGIGTRILKLASWVMSLLKL
jgi:hypothetical protein